MFATILLPGILGFVWGLAVSLFNHFWTYKALADPKSGKAVIFFTLRQAINLLAMFLVYKNVPMLIGTAMGLVAVKNYIFLTCLFDLKKQKRKG